MPTRRCEFVGYPLVRVTVGDNLFLCFIEFKYVNLWSSGLVGWFDAWVVSWLTCLLINLMSTLSSFVGFLIILALLLCSVLD